uniref:ATP synthase F1 subunit epsilon n=2 Tax=Clytia hemisphaerica TaxID=252671 RepID=A0A7M5UHT6_9CNID
MAVQWIFYAIAGSRTSRKSFFQICSQNYHIHNLVMALRTFSFAKNFVPTILPRMMSSEAGSGSGKGGGSGGSIRDAGGAFGKMEAAHEDQYFRKLQADLLAKIKREHQEQALYHDDEISFHNDAINRHKEAIDRHKLLKSQHEATLRQHDGDEKQEIYNERNGRKK